VGPRSSYSIKPEEMAKAGYPADKAEASSRRSGDVRSGGEPKPGRVSESKRLALVAAARFRGQDVETVGLSDDQCDDLEAHFHATNRYSAPYGLWPGRGIVQSAWGSDRHGSTFQAGRSGGWRSNRRDAGPW